VRRSLRNTRLQLETLEDRCVLSSYNIVDLGGFSPSAINIAGQIAGAANGRATLWQNGALTDLGASGQANDVNDSGQVVGQKGAFLWDPSGGLRWLGFSAAYRVNSSTEVAGTGMVYNSSWGATLPNAYFWTPNGGGQDINSLVGFNTEGSEARAINPAGQLVGWTISYIFIDMFSLTGSGLQAMQNAAYIWDSTTSTKTLLGALPGDSSSHAVAINNAGQVVGTSGNVIGMVRVGHVYVPREAFLWQDGVMTDLGMPSASGINNLGQVVGGKYLWQNGALTDLNTLIDPSSGWVITSSSDINDNGQIVGQGTLNGQSHYFLMDPVDPSGTASFAVSGFPSSTTAGTAGSFSVTALDSSGATATGYTGTVYFTSSDPQAGLPSAYTFTTADAGAHPFSAALKTAGTQSVTVTDAAHGTSGTQGGIAVQPAAVSKFAVAGFPSPITAGVAGSLTVTAQDAYGNTVSSYAGTVSFSSSDAKAVLPANYAFTVADNGVHSFGATLKSAGTQSIAANDILIGSLAGTDAGIQVSPAAASRLAITGPASVTPGTVFSITVTAYDAYGNVATGYLGTVAFKSSDASAILPPNYSFTTTDKGVHIFTGLKLKKKGTQTITITDTLNALLTATLSISVN
jgi:probable HAF family extracellular repeat protein